MRVFLSATLMFLASGCMELNSGLFVEFDPIGKKIKLSDTTNRVIDIEGVEANWTKDGGGFKITRLNVAQDAEGVIAAKAEGYLKQIQAHGENIDRAMRRINEALPILAPVLGNLTESDGLISTAERIAKAMIAAEAAKAAKDGAAVQPKPVAPPEQPPKQPPAEPAGDAPAQAKPDAPTGEAAVSNDPRDPQTEEPNP